jgi:hypothetical protein
MEVFPAIHPVISKDYALEALELRREEWNLHSCAGDVVQQTIGLKNAGGVES